jgi:hypothetical protein
MNSNRVVRVCSRNSGLIPLEFRSHARRWPCMLCNGKLLSSQQETRPYVSGFLFDVIIALCVIVITIAQWKEALIVIVFGWHFRRSTWNVCAQHNINIFFSFTLCSYWSTKCIMLFWKMNEWESLNLLIVSLNVAWNFF